MTDAEQLEKELNAVRDKKSPAGTLKSIGIIKKYKAMGVIEDAHSSNIIDQEYVLKMKDNSVLFLLQNKKGTAVFSFNEHQTYFIAIMMDIIEKGKDNEPG